MIRLSHAVLCTCLGAIAPVPARADQPMTFPQTLDRNAAYRTAWKAITAGIRPGDAEARFLRVLNGPATPMQAVDMAGKRVLVGYVCEIHNCDANSVTVLIEASGPRMYAVQRRRIDVPLRYRFLGRPNGAMRAALVHQAERGDAPQRERTGP